MIVFYVFMLIITLLVPAIMLFFGYRWQAKPPVKINHSYGYRTKRSMSSPQAWIFAHKHCGKTWVKFGWFTALITVLAMVILPFITLDIAKVAFAGSVIVILQLIPLLAPSITTERALKREFGI